MMVWYVARGAGLAALLLLTISTAMGALISDRGRPSTRVIVQYVHRVAGALGLGLLALHIGTILADPWAKVGVTGALVPLSSSYRATWVALGSMAAYTFLLITVLGFARGRMAASPRAAKVWRGVHALAYVGWAGSMMHGLKSGTDSSVGWVRWIYLGCAVAVIGSVVARCAMLARPRQLVRPTTAVQTREYATAVAR